MLRRFWLAAILLMTSVMWSEQEEMFDQQLAEIAHVLLPLLSLSETVDAAGLKAPKPGFDISEALIYRLFAQGGAVLQQVDMAGRTTLPDLPALPAVSFPSAGPPVPMPKSKAALSGSL